MDIFDVCASSVKAILNQPKALIPALLLVAVYMVALATIALSMINSFAVAGSGIIASLGNGISASALIIGVWIVVLLCLDTLVRGAYVHLCYQFGSRKISLRRAFGASLKKYFALLGYECVYGAAWLLVFLMFISVLLYSWGLIFGSGAGGHAATHLALDLGVLTIDAIVFLLWIVVEVLVSGVFWLGPSLIVLGKRDVARALHDGLRIFVNEWGNIIGTFVIAWVFVVCAGIVGGLVGFVPILGIVAYFAVLIGIVAFYSIVAPMYFINFHR